MMVLRRHLVLVLTVATVACLSTLVYAAKTWPERQLFPPSLIPDNALSPRRRAVRRKIILYHNFFRSRVQPSASNMLSMSWHGLAARQAQAHADGCVFLRHNSGAERTVPRLGSCGQNIFVSSQKAPWFYAIKSWFLEYRNFTYGEPVTDLKSVGHYTQMVWATSYKVGCGLARCEGGPWGHFYNFVCNYCPGGNVEGIESHPYKAGAPCGDCPDHCVAGGALCGNYCPHLDAYDNCRELVEDQPEQFCSHGGHGHGSCNATCVCAGDRIHGNYPW